jgi:hypothetical protein
MNNKKVENNLNQIFGVLETVRNNNPNLPAKTVEQIDGLIGVLEDDQVSEYCKGTLYSIIEKSKDAFDVVCQVLLDAPDNANNIKAFSALLTSITTAISSLDKINIDSFLSPKKKETEEVVNQITAEEAMKLLMNYKRNHQDKELFHVDLRTDERP